MNKLLQCICFSYFHIVQIKEYVKEFRLITKSSLETLFGTKEYNSSIQPSIANLFNNLGNHQSTDDDVSKSASKLFAELVTSSYRRFMTKDNDLVLSEDLKKCLVTKAFDIEAFSTQRELLYTLTSATSLIQILRTLFVYFDVDIQRLKTSATLNSQQCLQRYVRETLCPFCIHRPSSLSLPVDYDDNINEPLCENDCQFVITTCFNDTSNPYIVFSSIAQAYSKIIKQIEESIVELKVII